MFTSPDYRWDLDTRTTYRPTPFPPSSAFLAPLKRFGLFVGKFSTRPEAIAGSGSQHTCHRQKEQKILVQIGKPIHLTCVGDESRPPALLEFNFNGEKIALSSRNRTSCKRVEAGGWCVVDVATFRHVAFNLLVMEYRKNVHAIKGLVSFTSVKSIVVLECYRCGSPSLPLGNQ